MSQGTLQYLFEFQTQVALLTGMEVANASMYDGATACAEAVMMANRVTGRKKAVLSGGLHPHYREVCATYARFVGFELAATAPAPGGDEDLARLVDGETACVVVQNPDFFGELRDWSELARACHDKGALLVVVVTEMLSLGAIKPPGEMGADIVAAEGQSLGNALNFGGPYLGLFATRDKFVRQMPGRLVGQTVDAEGRRGWVLTLSTREQHIRREKATSNICTNSGLCALAFTIHLALLGEAGLARLARLNHAARGAARRAASAHPGRRSSSTTRSSTNSPCACRARRRRSSRRWRRAAFSAASRSAGSIRSARTWPICCWWPRPRRRPTDDIDRLDMALAGGAAMNDWSRAAALVRPPGRRRSQRSAATAGCRSRSRCCSSRTCPAVAGSICRTPPPFAARLGGLERRGPIGLPGLSEPQVVRHFTRLSQKNYAIDSGLYPLGSCTMKHNPRLNEKLARLPGFADLHPLQPVSTVQGALELIDTLAHWLKTLTGHAGGGAVAGRGRARRALRHDDDPRRARSARRPRAGACWCRNRRTAPTRRRRPPAAMRSTRSRRTRAGGSISRAEAKLGSAMSRR